MELLLHNKEVYIIQLQMMGATTLHNYEKRQRLVLLHVHENNRTKHVAK